MSLSSLSGSVPSIFSSSSSSSTIDVQGFYNNNYSSSSSSAFIVGNNNNNNNIDANVVNTTSTSSNKSNRLLIVAHAALAYLPVTGTVIGIKNAVKAYKAEGKLDNWEKAKIVTQIFSFLIVPQIILGSAYAVKSLIAHIEAARTVVVTGDDQVQDDQVQDDQVQEVQIEEVQIEEVEGEEAVSSVEFEVIPSKVTTKAQSVDSLRAPTAQAQTRRNSY